MIGRGLLFVGCAVVMGAGCEATNHAGPAVPIEPAALYAQNCSRCHGVDGKGDPELKKTMPIRDLSDPEFQTRARNDEIERLIMTGRNLMPAFGGALSMPKIQAVTGYLRRFGKTGKP